MATVSATGQEAVQRFFDPLLHGFKHVPFDDIDALKAAITPQTCAVMLEPVQGEGGVRIAGEDYFAKVRQLCDEHQVLLIFDEVQTGLGRTGKLFAHEHFGIAPDIMTLAKALAGGAPVGTMLARKEIAKSFSPGTHGSTFGGNPLMTSAAIATINTLLGEQFLERADRMGAYLVDKLTELKFRYPFIREVRGLGLMVGMTLDIPGADIVLQGLEKGLLLNVTQGKVLRFVPPLIVTETEIDEMVQILDEILKTV